MITKPLITLVDDTISSSKSKFLKSISTKARKEVVLIILMMKLVDYSQSYKLPSFINVRCHKTFNDTACLRLKVNKKDDKNTEVPIFNF